MSNKKELLIAGVYEKTAAYPNTKFRIEGFHSAPDLLVTEINTSRQSLGYQAVNTLHGRLSTAANIFISHLFLMIKFSKMQSIKNLYVPYPGFFFCFLLSFIPKKRRPQRIILDAFISLYDTVVLDRALVSATGTIAKCIKFIEHKALKCADIIVTDTVLNSQYLSQIYKLPIEKFIDIPLATDEKAFKKITYAPNKAGCNILFIGTMVPLHGIKVILDAIDRMKDIAGISFTIIGLGQEQHYIEEYTNHHENVISWIKNWQSSTQLYEHIKAADICLGIFDDGAKAQRVCPFKLYMYAACGKPIVTAETDWTRHIHSKADKEIFEVVNPGDSIDLAKKLSNLCENTLRQSELSAASAAFYKDYLSNEAALNILKSKLL